MYGIIENSTLQVRNNWSRVNTGRGLADCTVVSERDVAATAILNDRCQVNSISPTSAIQLGTNLYRRAIAQMFLAEQLTAPKNRYSIKLRRAFSLGIREITERERDGPCVALVILHSARSRPRTVRTRLVHLLESNRLAARPVNYRLRIAPTKRTRHPRVNNARTRSCELSSSLNISC